MIPDTQKEKQLKSKVSEKKETFTSGLFSLMTKQCIFSALLFGGIYLIKNVPLPFSEPVCTVIKDVIGFDMTFDYVKNIFTGFFF